MAERRHGPFEMAVMSSVLSVNYSFTQHALQIWRFCLVLGYEGFRHAYRILSRLGRVSGCLRASINQVWGNCGAGPLGDRCLLPSAREIQAHPG